MNNAVGMTPGYDGWKNTPLLENIKPCLLKDGIVNYYLDKDNYTLKEDGNPSILTGTDGDVMIEIPLIGYKMWNDDTYQYISVTMDPDKEKDGYCYYAHSLDNEKDCDKIYMGAYLGYKDTDNKLYSRSDVQPTVRTTLTDFRTYAKNRGTGYSLTSFFPHTLLQCLYVIVYKNLNSQEALGQGYVISESTDRKNTGGTNSNTFCYGTTSDTQQVKLFGMEDFYGNASELLDGFYNTGDTIKTDYRNSVFTGIDGSAFQFTSTNYLNNPSFYGTIKKIHGTNTTGFTPKTYASSNNTTYYCDEGDGFKSFCSFGGGVGTSPNSIQGIFAIKGNKENIDYSSYKVGARLMYKHKK